MLRPKNSLSPNFKLKFEKGKLDYSSEGLMVLTNNGDMAAALEANDTIERVFIQ